MMKQLNGNELNQVAGAATFEVAGHTTSIDSTGIPDTCFKELVGYVQALTIVEGATPDWEAFGKQMAILQASGCIKYFETFKNRLESATLV